MAGVFYDGTDYPAEYRGKYFFGDYSVGKLFTLDVANPTSAPTFAESPTGGGPVKFAIGPDGNVWYLSITSSDLRRIVYDPTGSQCPGDQFTGEWWESSTIPAGTPPDIVTCDPTLPDGGWNGTGNGLRPPNGLDATGGFSVRWVGRPLTDTGTYSVTKQATQPMVVKVDDQVISGNQFRVDSATATQATPKIEVSVSSSSPVDSAYRLSWVRQGSGPTVKLSGITQGVRVANGTKLGWTVTATDAQDGSLTGAAVRTEVVLLHYNGEDAHQHTDASMSGTAGSFDFGDTHSPGVAVYRVVARATDSSGWSEQSAPVYVCLDGNLVGVCS